MLCRQDDRCCCILNQSATPSPSTTNLPTLLNKAGQARQPALRLPCYTPLRHQWLRRTQRQPRMVVSASLRRPPHHGVSMPASQALEAPRALSFLLIRRASRFENVVQAGGIAFHVLHHSDISYYGKKVPLETSPCLIFMYAFCQGLSDLSQMNLGT